MQEGNKNLGMLKKRAIWMGNFYFKSCSLNTVDFKKPVSFGWQEIFQEKNRAIRIASKHNNSLETFPYAIQNHLVVHRSDVTLQRPS